MIVKKIVFEVNGKVVETINGYQATMDDIVLTKVAMSIKYNVKEDDVDMRVEDEDVSYIVDPLKIRNSRIQLIIEITKQLRSGLN